MRLIDADEVIKKLNEMGVNYMTEVDCRKCINCGKDECKKYGKDAEKATKQCAKDNFKNYKMR